MPTTSHYPFLFCATAGKEFLCGTAIRQLYISSRQKIHGVLAYHTLFLGHVGAGVVHHMQCGEDLNPSHQKQENIYVITSDMELCSGKLTLTLILLKGEEDSNLLHSQFRGLLIPP